jgi:NAD(P)-dependent dehydrogenase (short-subunit alcohol dehydrogenase family)
MKIVLFGAGGTVGRAVQSALDEAGHEVIGVSRYASAFQADIRDIESLKDVYRKIGSFDHVASAAGDVFPAPLEETTDEQWADSFASKAMGQINLVRAGIPLISDKGSFTLISGILTDEVVPASTVGTTINHTVEGFVKGAATELPRGIRINCVSPTVLTESTAYHPYFPGFQTVDASEVGQAYLRAISNPMTGRVLKLHKTES